MMHYRPAVIEALTRLWVALPVKAPAGDESDPRERQKDILDAYCRALRDVSEQAVSNVVDALEAGKIKEASKRFCPTAAELAVYAREEQKRLDAISRPKMVSYQPVARPWKDWRIVQRERTRELAGQGYVLVADNCTHELSRTRYRTPGNIWFWAIQEVWGRSV